MPQTTVFGPHSGVSTVQVPGGHRAAGFAPPAAGTTPIIRSRTLKDIDTSSLGGLSLQRRRRLPAYFAFFVNSARRAFNSSMAASNLL
jgi:hypothetical protein